MEEITRRIDSARRRLLLRRFAGNARDWLALALSVALVAVLIPRVWPLPGLPRWWDAVWLGGAAVAGLAVASLATWRRAQGRLDAAVEIDRRFDLRERVASAVSLSEGELATEAGAALLRDARRAVSAVDVPERFRLGADRKLWRPLAPGLVALVAATLVSNRAAEATPEPPAAAQAVEDAAKKAAAEARRQLARKRARAEKEGLTDATALLKKIEEGTSDLEERGPKNLTQAAVKLNDLSQQLAERRQKLGGGEELRSQLNRMKDLDRGPAEKAADAMKRGDWKRAQDEVAKLRDDLAAGKVSPEDREKLAAQLGKLQERLGEAARQQAAQKEALERQLADAQRKGDLNQAGKLQQKLEQLAQKAPQLEKLGAMAQQMAKAQQALDKGDPKQAADALDQMAQQMAQMAREDQEMEMLDAAMTDIQMAKEGMGMEAEGPPLAAGRGKNQEGQPGDGRGEGRGSGERPDEKNDVAFRDSQVKQEVGRGASTFGGLVRGPSVKGEVAQAIKTPLDAAAAEPADPLTSERLPRSRREHAEEYFRQLRERL